jgi:hypothetical protein
MADDQGSHAASVDGRSGAWGRPRDAQPPSIRDPGRYAAKRSCVDHEALDRHRCGSLRRGGRRRRAGVWTAATRRHRGALSGHHCAGTASIELDCRNVRPGDTCGSGCEGEQGAGTASQGSTAGSSPGEESKGACAQGAGTCGQASGPQEQGEREAGEGRRAGVKLAGQAQDERRWLRPKAHTRGQAQADSSLEAGIGHQGEVAQARSREGKSQC